MTRPKVLLVSSLYTPIRVGGAERVVQTLAEALVPAGVDAAVVTLTPEPAGGVEVVEGVTVHRVPIPNFHWPFGKDGHGLVHRAAWHARDAYNRHARDVVAGIIADEAPDVVNTHSIAGFSTSVWSSAADADVPLVHTMHDQYLLCPRTTMFRDGENCVQRCRACRLFTLPAERMSRRPSVVTGPSRFVLDRHAEHGWFGDAERLVVRNAQAPVSAPVRVSGRADGPLRFGFLGRLAETKGVDRLLQAYADLPDGAAELLIGGTGEPGYEGRLRAIAGDRADVRWLGFVDPSDLLGQIDVLVVPSTWDDTATLVVMEGFAHRRPVIGADRGGIPEMVGRGDGWIVDPDDRAALTARLAACIDERDALAERGDRCHRASLELTVDRMVDGYRAAYRRAGAAGF